MEGMEEIVQEFLVESHENLDQLDQDLLALERDPTSRDLLSSIFRTLHTRSRARAASWPCTPWSGWRTPVRACCPSCATAR